AFHENLIHLVANRKLPPSPVREPLPCAGLEVVEEIIEIPPDPVLAVLLLPDFAAANDDAIRPQLSLMLEDPTRRRAMALQRFHAISGQVEGEYRRRPRPALAHVSQPPDDEDAVAE